MENEIIPVQPQTTFLAPAATISQLRERYLIFNQFVKDVLRTGVDFMVIPGTDKPSLAKPGAEKLAALFGLSARFIVAEKVEDWDGNDHNGEPFFYYSYRCELYRADQFVASCDGSCNSREKKYRYRTADLVCPVCGKPNIRKSKDAGRGWYCWAKTGGCSATFPEGDKRITEQPRGMVANPDIADVVNTIQKMSQKRSYVGAVLIATNASEYFTQDIEEMPGFVDATFVEQPTTTTGTTTTTTTTTTGSTEPEQKKAQERVAETPSTEKVVQGSNGNGNGEHAEAPVYAGSTAVLGKHKYPVAWAKELIKYARCNQYEMDGILQKLALAGTTPVEDVIAEIEMYLDRKQQAQA